MSVEPCLDIIIQAIQVGVSYSVPKWRPERFTNANGSKLFVMLTTEKVIRLKSVRIWQIRNRCFRTLASLVKTHVDLGVID